MTPGAIAEQRRAQYNATVVWLRKPNPDLMLIRIRPDKPRAPHQPGQYCTLGMGTWEARVPGCALETVEATKENVVVKRAYSISCSILDDSMVLLDVDRTDWLEYYIVLVRDTGRDPPPALTPRLFMLQEGDRLFMGEKIVGHYTLAPVQQGDTVVFLATGTGEAPHNYLLWDLLRRGHTGHVVSACCVRYQRDLGYLAIHEELMRRYPHYAYLSLTTREALPAGRKVYIQDLITSGQLEARLGKALDPATTHVYLCGNPNMIGVPVKDKATGLRTYPMPLGVVEILEKRGFQLDRPQIKQQGNIHVEEYW
jgi:ferredoxin/flavodoxin---NADP+ reductase